MLKRALHLLGAAWLAVMLLPDSTAAQRAGQTVTMDFKDVEIEDLVKMMSKLTGRNFMLDDRVRGKVTIISPTPISINDAYRVFLAALEFRGFTTVPSGRLLKIIPNQNAIKAPTEITKGKGGVLGSDNFITRIVKLAFVDANETATLLRNFASSYGQIQVHAPSNLLIIGDNANQVNRMLDIINEIDVPDNEQAMEFVKLEYANPQEIAKIINDIYAAQVSPGQPPGAAGRRPGGRTAVKIIAVDRLNSIIILGSSNDIAQAKDLIAKLDVKPEATGGTIHVYYLQYADAEQLAQTLGGFTQGAGTRARTGATPPAGAPPPGGVPAVAEFEGGIRITPDKATNSLLIVSSPADYQTLRALIGKLDVPRRQVYVEAVIMEVSVDKIRDLGLSWHSLFPSEDGVGFAGQALGGLNTLTLGTTQPPAFPGLFLGALSKPTTFNNVTIFGIGGLLRALQNDESVNILSTPNILTSDNQDAEIVVGQNVPFITGQTATTGGNVLTSIERQDVGITLKITPQINAGNLVKLKIQQETSSVQQAAPAGLNVNQQGLITRKRSAKTTVVVKDRQPVVIGGLMSDEVDRSESKLPILGDLPVLGWLFRSTNHTNRKTNLLIFLTPYVISTREDMEKYSNKREEFFHQFREDNYVPALSEEYTFRRAFGPRAGEQLVTDVNLLQSEKPVPERQPSKPVAPKPGSLTKPTGGARPPMTEGGVTAPAREDALKAEETDRRLPDMTYPAPPTMTPVPATEPVGPAAPL